METRFGSTQDLGVGIKSTGLGALVFGPALYCDDIQVLIRITGASTGMVCLFEHIASLILSRSFSMIFLSRTSTTSFFLLVTLLGYPLFPPYKKKFFRSTVIPSLKLFEFSRDVYRSTGTAHFQLKCVV